jgi:glutamine synthetase
VKRQIELFKESFVRKLEEAKKSESNSVSERQKQWETERAFL